MDTFTLLAGWTSWLVAALAVCPALLVWRLYAPLMKRLDDPVLPERLASRKLIAAGITIAGLAVVVALRPTDAWWSVPLVLVARLRVTYGVRRILLGENLTFSGYVFWFVRVMLAMSGLWLLIAGAPILILWADNYGPLVAIVLGIVMVLWTWRGDRVLLRLFRATPLERDDLQPRFAAIVDKTELAPPRVWQTGDPGAVFANAFALPSLRGASVLFTRTLLERLDADEIAAVYGHEIAHLEYFTPTRLQRLFLLTLCQAVGAALLVPAVMAFAEDAVEIAVIVWPVFVVMTLLLRASRVHANELASDRRGVELCGNPEALASGLTKLHAISRLPARWESRSTTHPSLARRVRALREQAGARPPSVDDPIVIEGAAANACLLFEPTNVRYLTGVPADAPRDAATLASHAADVRRFAYDDIRTCRLVARGETPPELLVIDRHGRRFTAPLRDADVPRIQALLDIVEPQAVQPEPAVVFDNRAVALMVLMLSLAGGPFWSVALASLLVLVQPATDLAIAAIAMMIAAGFVGLITPTASEVGQIPELMITAGALLLILVLLPRWRARAAHVTVPTWSILTLPLAALTTWLVVILQWDGGLLRLVQAIRDSSAVIALPIGAAVVCARARARPRLRHVLASACLLAALVPGVMTTGAFQQRVVRDPLLADMPELPRVPAKLTPVSHAQLQPGDVIRVSPGAATIASGWSESEDVDDGTPTVFAVRRADGRVERMAATDLQFLDDDRVLLLRGARGTGGLELAVHALGQVSLLNASLTGGAAGAAGATAAAAQPLSAATAVPPATAATAATDTTGTASPTPTPKPPRSASRGARGGRLDPAEAMPAPWTLRLPDFVSGRLSVDPRTGRWRVAGQNRAGDWVRVQGVLGNEILDETHWTTDASRTGAVLFESGRAIVSVKYTWSTSLLGRLAPRLATVTAHIPSPDVTLQRIEAGRTTSLVDSQATVDCLEPEVNAGMTACVAFDGVDTRIWSIDAEHGTLLPIGRLRGYARPLARGLDGSILVWYQRRPVIVHPRSPRAIDLTAGDVSAPHWLGGAYTPGHLVVVSDVAEISTITTYRFALDERIITAGGPPAQASADRVMLDGR